jgi:hypothetical protein
MSDASGRAKDGHYAMFEDKGKQDGLRNAIAAVPSAIMFIPYLGQESCHDSSELDLVWKDTLPHRWVGF